MPYPLRQPRADRVCIQLIEADVEIGFGLVDDARAYRASGQEDFSSRALKTAAEVAVDIERRARELDDAQAGPFLPLLAELRFEIASVERENP